MTRWLLAGVLVLAAAAGGDWAAWSLVTSRMRDAFGAWSSAMRAQGWTLANRPPVAAGFPFAAVLIVPEFDLSGGDGAIPAGMHWSAEQVELAITLFHPRRLRIEPQGREALRISRSPQIAFTADRIAAWLPLGRLGVAETASGRLLADGMAGGLVGSTHPADVRVAHLSLDMDVARDVSGRTDAALVVDAQSVALPDTGRWPLGANVAGLFASLSLSSPMLGKPGEAREGDAGSEAAAWRDGGGKVVIETLDLKWGPLTLGLRASLGLDGKLQPTGHGTARAAGYDAALDALSRAGTITQGVADTAKAVLGLMGRTPADNAPGLELPFNLKDATLSLGKIPLTRVSLVDWGRV